MKALIILFFSILSLPVLASLPRYAFATDTLKPEAVNADEGDLQRQKAKQRIRQAGSTFVAAGSVFGAGMRVAEKQRLKHLRNENISRKNPFVPVLFAVSGLLVVVAVALFISWVGMKKGKKESRLSFHAPPAFPNALHPQWSSGMRIRIGKR